MRMAALVQRAAAEDPAAFSPEQALRAATNAGAAALGLADRIGSLEPGKQADLITVSMTGARQTPMFDPISHLVYVAHGDDVRTTIVAGRVLMQDRHVLTVDEGEVLRDARAMAERVRRAVTPKDNAVGR
jgi:5-methylthioadenosine/S-adenosylhomocysteine deaminase